MFYPITLIYHTILSHLDASELFACNTRCCLVLGAMQNLLTDIVASEEKVVNVHEGSKCAILDDTSEKYNPL